MEAITPQNIIGPTVKRLRKSLHLTQGDLAARCGVLGWDISENTVTKIEKGIRCITDKELVPIARALNVKLPELFPDYPDLS